MQLGMACVKFPGKKHYKGVMFNVISVTRGWVAVHLPEKMRYVTLERPLTSIMKESKTVPCHMERSSVIGVCRRHREH